MRLRQGVQAEVLLSLALVMVTGTGLLAGVFLEVSHARVEALHGLLGRGFVSTVNEVAFEANPPAVGLWWRLDGGGRTLGLNAPTSEADAETLRLGEEAIRTGEPIVLSGAPWEALRFAGQRANAPGAIVGRIDAPVSGAVLALLVAADVLIFGLCGATLLRRRVVGPLHRLAQAVRDLGGDSPPARVPVEGVAEIEALGGAFNEMRAALASRTGALEEAVAELRAANASLMQAREGLDRAERLAMVGSMAAGVAHEVGNPMGAMLAFLDVAGRDTGLGDEGRRCLEKAGEQGERVRLILRQLLDFSRPPRVDHVCLALDPIARQAVELVGAQQAYSDIDFEVTVEEGLPPAVGDASLASQILLNLTINSAAALQGCATRRIRVEVAGEVRRRRAADGEGDPPPGRIDAIVCRVGDSGPGIHLDEPERIFDPFFTTKAPGEGTGLGLANARRLAQEMGGDVALESDGSPLGGALFQFWLPVEEAGGVPGDRVRETDRQSRMP